MVQRAPGRAGTTPGGRQTRFPGFDVLSQVGAWDALTAGVVLRRLGPAPALRFFTPEEEAIGEALVDVLLGQDEEPKVPVLRMIDVRLAELQTDGWHYADLPEDGAAWRLSLQHLDEDARDRHGAGFPEVSVGDQARLTAAVHDGTGQWHGLDREHLWSLWTRYACTAFYSHPWAWNEIGFPGPAYPRGYKNMGIDKREPFEVPDAAPRDPLREFSPENRR